PPIDGTESTNVSSKLWTLPLDGSWTAAAPTALAGRTAALATRAAQTTVRKRRKSVGLHLEGLSTGMGLPLLGRSSTSLVLGPEPKAASSCGDAEGSSFEFDIPEAIGIGGRPPSERLHRRR